MSHHPDEASGERSQPLAIVAPFIHGMVFLVHHSNSTTDSVAKDRRTQKNSTPDVSYLLSAFHKRLALSHSKPIAAVRRQIAHRFLRIDGATLDTSSSRSETKDPDEQSEVIYREIGSSGSHSFTDPLFECGFTITPKVLEHVLPTGLKSSNEVAVIRLTFYDFGVGAMTISGVQQTYAVPLWLTSNGTLLDEVHGALNEIFVNPIVNSISTEFRDSRSPSLEKFLHANPSDEESPEQAVPPLSVVPWSHTVRYQDPTITMNACYEIRFGESIVSKGDETAATTFQEFLGLLERAQVFYLACLLTNQAISAIEASLLQKLSLNDFRTCARMQRPALSIERYARFLISRMHLYEVMLHPTMRSVWETMLKSWDLERLEADVERQSSSLSESSRAIGSIVQSRSAQLFSVFFFIVTILGLLSITTSVLGFEFSGDKTVWPDKSLIIFPLIGFSILSGLTFIFARFYYQNIGV